MTPRQAYVAKRLALLVLIGLAIAGYIHGIIWAAGINQPGNNWSHNGMPWQAKLIDFAPEWLVAIGTVSAALSLLGEWAMRSLLGGYLRLPTKAQALAAKQAEREATIARLERELGLLEPMPAPPCSHRFRRRLAAAGFRQVCDQCGAVFEGREGDWHE